jgi:pilus assembly protein CpaC
MSDGQIRLEVGHQKVLHLGTGLTRIAIGDPAIADTTALHHESGGGDLIIVGKSVGTTDLLVWDAMHQAAPMSYSITVSHSAGHALDGALGSKLTTSIEGGSARVSGMSTSLEDHGRTVDAAAAMTASGGKAGVVIDQSTVSISRTVQVDVKVVEFSKSVLKEAGFNIFTNRAGFAFGSFSPSTLSSITLPSAGTAGGVGFVSQAPITSAFNLIAGHGAGVLGSLSILENNGLARVLAEPSLTALSGQSANFLSGGEIPIPVPQSFGNVTIEYKPFGIGLTVTPTVLAEDRIALKVAPEASDLDYTNAVTLNGVSVPAITTRRADTMVELGDGESFVIGGLVSNSTISNVNKVPILGDLPILGTFFKNVNYQKSEKELVIVVTPHLVRPIVANAVLPLTPGEAQEQHNAPVWQSFVFGALDNDALPGFSN